MKNEIYVSGKLVVENKNRSFFKHGYKIRCNECEELIERKWFENKILEERYICKTCKLKINNPMFDPIIKNKHSEICKTEEYRKNVSESIKGEKNGFYGKTHNEETIEKIKKGFKSWFNNLTEEEYQNWTKEMSLGNIKLMTDQPEFYKNIKSKAAKFSHKKQFENCKMNKIEKKVDDYLKILNVNYKYSIILGGNQYDFGIKEMKILIEVDGDYWHGNPKFYNLDGSNGKRKLNNIQLEKIKQDEIKNKFAIDHQFKIIRLWECDINNNKFKEILKNEIN